MKRILLILFGLAALCFAQEAALAAGAVTQARSQLEATGWGTMQVVRFSWTADASDGSVPATALAAASEDALRGWFFYQAEANPGSPAPTVGYSVTVTDGNGADLLDGTGKGRSSTATEIILPPASSRPISGNLTVNVTGNSVNSATGTVDLYFVRAPGPGARMVSPVLTLQSAVTKAASYSGTPFTGLSGYIDLVVTLNITSAERDTGNETYDFYITTSDGVSSWDLAHFPQIATTGAKIYTALIAGVILPETVTTASPGVVSISPGTLKTDTASADQGIKTLAAGTVRHGPWGDRINHELVVAGAVATGIAYSITILPK